MKVWVFCALLSGAFAVGKANSNSFIDTVFVGDAGNLDDETGFGGVSYDYHIGKYEVTNAQYTEFLNSVAASDTHSLYSTEMAGPLGGIMREGADGSYSYSTTKPNEPVVFVSFNDAARFANWLTNERPVGVQDLSTTEDGMYFLNGITDQPSLPRNGNSASSGYAITSEDEWYKAAYYNASGLDYWFYPVQTDESPTPSLPNNTDPTSANHSFAVGTPVDVGSYEVSLSPYGTLDQAGNVEEMLDSHETSNIFRAPTIGISRGGTFNNINSQNTAFRVNSLSDENERKGFRISAVGLTPVPNPKIQGYIFPSISVVLNNSQFDFQLIAQASPSAEVASFSLQINGEEFGEAFLEASEEIAIGDTARAWRLRSLDLFNFAPGSTIIEFQVDFTDGSFIEESVEWFIVPE